MLVDSSVDFGTEQERNVVEELWVRGQDFGVRGK